LFRKALRRGVCSQSFTTDDLISAADKKLFRRITSNKIIAYIHYSPINVGRRVSCLIGGSHGALLARCRRVQTRWDEVRWRHLAACVRNFQAPAVRAERVRLVLGHVVPGSRRPAVAHRPAGRRRETAEMAAGATPPGDDHLHRPVGQLRHATASALPLARCRMPTHKLTYFRSCSEASKRSS